MFNSATPVLSVAVGVLLALTAGCGEGAQDDEPPCKLERSDDGEPFETLSEYCFFEGDPATHQGGEGVVPYDVTAELYSDHSHKQRFIVLPDDEPIGFDATEPWTWPDETILIKTFYYPDDERDAESDRRILETRLLTKRQGEWEPEIYVWDDDQEDARLHNLGRRVDVEFTDRNGDLQEIDYRIPNRNQCADCHAQDGDLAPLGPRTRQLGHPYQFDDDRPPQIEEFADRGMFDQTLPETSELPAVTNPRDEDADLDDRARSYLDANCAHCHNPDGRASSSNLMLDVDETDDRKVGICKTPVAAGSASGGHNYDIVPGKPDESIMIYRMESQDPEVKMPELPITTVHDEGVELVRHWIAEMEPEGCD